MKIMKCNRCGKDRWARGTEICKPCRRKMGLREAAKMRRRYEPKVIVPIASPSKPSPRR